MWLPDDVVAEIAAHAPDPRPLLLTCRQFYAVFTEMPDIAYWCSGCDPKFMMLKHFGEVSGATMADIIDADNVAVFAAVYDPNRVDLYWLRVIHSDAADIFRFLDAAHPDTAPKYAVRGPKCFALLTRDEAIECTIRTELTLTAWRGCGMTREFLPLDIAARYSPCVPGLFNTSGYVEYCERVYPRPPYDLYKFVVCRPLARDLLRYLAAYGKRVTLLVIAVALGRLFSPDIVTILRHYTGEAAFVMGRQSFFTHKAEIRDYLISRGAKYIVIPQIQTVPWDPYAIDLFLPDHADDVRQLLGPDQVFIYTAELANKCAAHGVEVTPSELTFDLCRNMREVFEHVRADNRLLVKLPRAVAIVGRHPNFGDLLRHLTEFAAVDGYASVVAEIKNIANFKYPPITPRLRYTT